jgi:hypothetical protein
MVVPSKESPILGPVGIEGPEVALEEVVDAVVTGGTTVF